jgi:AraC-like DNA-binding protein
LPHNWIATDVSNDAVPVRNLVIQFLDEPFRRGMALFPELADLVPLFDRATHGIQFFGISDDVRRRFYRVKESRGLERFSEFTGLLLELARCQNYQLLSSARMQSAEDPSSLERINTVLDFLNNNYAQDLSMGDLCALVGMSESGFSRFFQRTTGNTFTDYLTQLRISKACQLLLHTDRYVNSVCQEVGFRNVAYFNRRFLELKGATPTEFRRSTPIK